VGGDDATYLRVKSVLESEQQGDRSDRRNRPRLHPEGRHQYDFRRDDGRRSRKPSHRAKAGWTPKSGRGDRAQRCRSGVIEAKLPKMIAGDYEPHFSLKHMFKDVQLGIRLANGLNIEIRPRP